MCVKRKTIEILKMEKLGLNQNLRPPLRLKVDKTLKHLHVEIRNHVYQLQLVELKTFSLSHFKLKPLLLIMHITSRAVRWASVDWVTAVTRVLLYKVEECASWDWVTCLHLCMQNFLAERKCCFGWFRDVKGEFCPFQTLLWGIEHISPPYNHACWDYYYMVQRKHQCYQISWGHWSPRLV